MIPASDLDTSAEFAKALNRSNAENSAQKVEEEDSEHNGNEGINESSVMNGTSKTDESFIPETQFEISIDFELGDSSMDNKKTEPKTHTEIKSQIENVKSFISDAIESNDSISVSAKQDGSCEIHEMVDNGLISKTEDEALNQTEIMLAENVGDINQDHDKENTPIQPTEPYNDITIDDGKYNIQNANKMHKMSYFFKIRLFH